jgi:hypothetical protein
VDYILNDLYLAKYDGSQPYTTSLECFILFLSEAFLSCNARLLARAGREPSFEYDFSVPPAPHGNDLAYTFCNGLSISVERRCSKSAARIDWELFSDRRPPYKSSEHHCAALWSGGHVAESQYHTGHHERHTSQPEVCLVSEGSLLPKKGEVIWVVCGYSWIHVDGVDILVLDF